MRLFLLLPLIALLSACGETNNGDGAIRHVTQFDYDPALCTTLKPDTGGAADFGDITQSRPVTSDFFGKRYNRALLEGVLSASDLDTESYVSQMGVQLFKIPYLGTDNTCLFHHSLSEAPADFREVWDEAAGGDHGGGHLDGLFVSYLDNTGQAGEAIMVRETSSRWTLVHEMTHANFHRQRVADGTLEGLELRDAVTKSADDYEQAFTNYKYGGHRSQDLAALVTAADSRAKLLYQALVQGPLEEIADESLLLEEWSAGRLQYVSNDSAVNASWYIHYSHTQALQQLNDYQTTVQEAADYVKANPPDASVAESNDFQKIYDYIAAANAAAEVADQKALTETAAIRPPDQTAHIAAGLAVRAADRAVVLMTNPHLEAMNNTPALLQFRRDEARLRALTQSR